MESGLEWQTGFILHRVYGVLSLRGKFQPSVSRAASKAAQESREHREEGLSLGDAEGGPEKASWRIWRLRPVFLQKEVVILKADNLVEPEGENSVPCIFSAGEELIGCPLAILLSSCCFGRF